MSNPPVSAAELASCLVTLHERGVLNEKALLAVCKDLLDHKPLTVVGLAAVFGVAPIADLFRQKGFLRWPSLTTAAARRRSASI